MPDSGGEGPDGLVQWALRPSRFSEFGGPRPPRLAVASAMPLQSGLRGAAAASAERPLGLIAPTGKIALPGVRERGGKSERPNEGQARQGCAATSREDGVLPRCMNFVVLGTTSGDVDDAVQMNSTPRPRSPGNSC